MSFFGYAYMGQRGTPVGGATGGGGGGAATYESAGTGTGAASTTLTITKPSGLTAGDLMVAIVSATAGSTTTWSKSGWTALASAPAARPYIAVLWRIADSSDAAASTFDFTASQAVNSTGGILRISGAHATTPIPTHGWEAAYASTGTSSQTPDAPSSGSTSSGSYLAIVGIGADNDRTFTVPTDYTEAFDLNDGNNSTCAAGYYVAGTTTAVDPGTWTMSTTGVYTTLVTFLVAPA